MTTPATTTSLTDRRLARTRTVMFRLTPADYTLIASAASIAGAPSISEFVRSTLIATAQSIVVHETEIRNEEETLG